MAFYNQYLNWTLLGSSGLQWAEAIGIFLIIIFGVLILKAVIMGWLKVIAKKTKNDFDDALLDAIDEIKWPFYVLIALFSAAGYLSVNNILDKITFILTILVVVFYIGKILRVIIVHGARLLGEKNKSKDEVPDDTMAHVLSTIIQIFIWVGAILFILSNLGFNVGTALAGVGIGGIAIAFALQNVLSDIFASFSIYFDKPFKKGDYIVIGTDMGVVERIGIKSTRIKTLQGQELVVSNKELTETRVNNFKKMERRRAVFTLGVTYDTSVKKLEKIPKIIAKIFERVDNADLDRAHFKSYGDFSLNYEIVYYVNAPDYAIYMDIQQDVNLEIKRTFEKEKIEFAYPTQTLFIEKLKK
ncbi:mechanosensitive ion channel family protein [Candidatus Woesearchaeota archaeon]|nr:mechanosensitive ion channel family protein [Candidatus Woesearchaeota archaeon]MCF7900944.1 mechanosensitive ion channel family protein [Candidatus Woesearchaeota archaeon]MCF8013610.1 mechanosensitive ion channel family protein [Candidatus Woesearchaeota archaeon]